MVACTSTPSAPGREPAVLGRLRQAVRATGLSVDVSAPGAADAPGIVTNRLAQTTVRYLTSVDAETGQRLSEELRALSSPQDWAMLMEDRGYTHYHVVQFLYEFARHYARVPAPQYFCAGMGRGGGGIQVAPEDEIVSLVRLLTTAMPAGSDGTGIALLMELLGPLIVGKIFPTQLLRMDVERPAEGRLIITLRYADRQRLQESLAPIGLRDDACRFFYHTALHVQGALELGWRTLVANAPQTLTMSPLIEARSDDEQRQLAQACACTWEARWTPEVQLARMGDAAQVLEQGRALYDALHRKDDRYYLERIKSLEARVEALEAGDRYHDLIGRSAAMHRVYDVIRQVADTDLTVLVRGESGTGKELVARAIHETSRRRQRPFVAVNCAALTESLLESELFGHERGAFTGADRRKPGRFEQATGGTLFLDEAGDIPLPTQVKLLRVLETRRFERVGGTETIATDVRIIGATHRDLEELIREGRFREDLYFRLNVLPVDLPPLREHADDVPQLAQHFLEETARRAERPVRGFSRAALRRLSEHAWPGNIRELRNVIERAAVVYARGEVVGEDDVQQALGVRASAPRGDDRLNLRQQRILVFLRDEQDGCRVEDLLEVARRGGRASGASRRTLQNDLRRLAELGLVEWSLDGSARVYSLSEAGAGAADAVE